MDSRVSSLTEFAGRHSRAAELLIPALRVSAAQRVRGVVHRVVHVVPLQQTLSFHAHSRSEAPRCTTRQLGGENEACLRVSGFVSVIHGAAGRQFVIVQASLVVFPGLLVYGGATSHKGSCDLSRQISELCALAPQRREETKHAHNPSSCAIFGEISIK